MTPKPSLKQDWRLYRRLLKYVRPYWWMFLVSVLAMSIAAGATSGLARLMEPLVDKGFVKQQWDAVRWIPLLFVVFIMVRSFASAIGEYVITWIGRKVVAVLRNQSFAHMLRLPSNYFDVNGPATIVAKLIYNIEQMATSVTTVLVHVIGDGILAIWLFSSLVLLNWKLTLVMLVVAPISMLMVRAMSRGFRRKSHQIQDSVREISRVASQASSGYRVIRAFSAEEKELDVFAAATDRHRRQVVRKKALSEGGMALVQTVASFGLAFIVYIAIQTKMGAGEFSAYLAALVLFTGPVRRLSRINETIQTGLAAASTMFGLLDQPQEQDDGTRTLAHAHGRIEYRGVSFRYPGAQTDALQDISIVVEPGQTVALVGASGSGKTTLASLLPRFYRAMHGEVLLDHIDINELTLENLRSQIALVGQEALLFDDTVANNIAYGSPMDRERVEAVARTAHVLEFTEKLPQGLGTRVGDRGALLSGGQRQRIAIARALYKNAPVLILDEATSALDTESERLVQDAMRKLLVDRTTLVIAHRLSTIEHAHRIVVLSQGRIVESGSHQELLARGGAYAKLHNAQFAAATAAG